MSYLDSVLDPQKATQKVQLLLETIKASAIEFDFIAVRGMSGALIGGAVSMELSKPIVIVRKGESTHGAAVEYPTDMTVTSSKYIIIDDGIATGSTIIEILEKLGPGHFCCTCKGIFLYAQDDIWQGRDAEKLASILHQKLQEKNIRIKTRVYLTSAKYCDADTTRGSKRRTGCSESLAILESESLKQQSKKREMMK